jgi:hypothetical protein
MPTILVTFLLAGLLPAVALAKPEEPRKPNQFAPSLPELTDEEEAQIDKIIDRFIRYDIGELVGVEGRKALAEFHKLGPEAIPGLIRGMNKAARIEASCPALVIARKLGQMLRSSEDPQLLEFARENIGAGVTRSRHMGLLQDLRVVCMFRKRSLARSGITVEKARQSWSLKYLTVDELTEALAKAKGARRKTLLAELASRTDEEATAALAAAAGSKDPALGALGRTYLVRNLSQLQPSAIKDRLQAEDVEMRLAATRVAGQRRLRLGEELINMLADDSPAVRKAALHSLIKMSGGKNFGPKAGASESEQSEAMQKWRAWWASKNKR